MSQFKSARRCVPSRLYKASLVVAMATASGSVAALQIDTGNPDVKLRWDNAFKYSTGYRVEGVDSVLASDVNLGDGDTNFRKKGVISNRIDLLSELELSYKRFGFRLSGATWYDSVYRGNNDNNTAGAFGPGTSAVNSTDISSPTEFNPYTRKIHGAKAEVLDAFVMGRFKVADHATTVRVGQHSLQWGESLFFGENGVAGAMSPIDIAKAVSVPNLRFQEILRPVPQVSGQVQLSGDITAYAYYQLGWEENRSQGAGSYFSPIDFQKGGNLLFLPSGVLSRTATEEASDAGQGGIALRFRGEEVDYGVYAAQFHSKSSAIVSNPMTGGFYDHFHENIQLFGVSANRNIGLFNFAGEMSYRDNQDLLSPNAYDLGQGAQYAVGNTFHLNVSAFGTNLGKSKFWSDASLLAELAFTRVLSIDKNKDTMSGCQPGTFPGSVCQPNGTRDSLRLQVLFEPVIYQAFPGVDLRVPIGVSYQPKGSRNMFGSAPLAENGGSVNIGLNASYLDAWRFGLNATHFFGGRDLLFEPLAGSGTPAWNYGQVFGDRDYVTAVISRTF